MKNRFSKYLHRILQFPWVKSLIHYGKSTYEKTLDTNTQLKSQLLQFIPFFIASFLTGIVAFGYSRLFTLAENLSFQLLALNEYIVFVSTPVLFLISWLVVKKGAHYAQGSGIPQVMASLELTRRNDKKFINRFLNFKIIVVKILASVIKVLGGGVVGREGPTIHVASSIFNQVYRWLPKWWIPISQQNIVVAGAASGLAAAFNTPLGGIIFAIEELSKHHMKYIKAPLFVAVIIAGLTAQGLGGSYLYLGYPKTQNTGYMVFLGMFIVAILTGIFGTLMCRITLRVMRFFKSRNNLQQIPLVLFAGLFVATSIYFLHDQAMGSGKEMMEQLLFTDQKTVDWYLPFIRMNNLIASFGSGGAGGIFAPSLSSGATFGAVVSEFLSLNQNNTNLLILVGMTGFLTSVTRAPFTASIIIFEMTDRHSIIFMLLLAALIANMVAVFVDRNSFYEVLKENYLTEVKHQQKN